MYGFFGILKALAKDQIPEYNFVFNYRKFKHVEHLAERIDFWVKSPDRLWETVLTSDLYGENKVPGKFHRHLRPII